MTSPMTGTQRRRRLGDVLVFLLVPLAANVLLLSCAADGSPEVHRAERHEGVGTRLATYLETRAREDGFSGAVLVSEGETVLLRHAYGSAEWELDVPLESEHIQRIGSLSKPITAVAALRLVERGELDLSRSLCDVFPECPAPWSSATLEHLLSHSSGVPNLFEDVACAPVEDTAREIEATLARAPSALEFAPGESYAYNNFGYLLLAYAMELATGRLWEEILHAEVFEPLGMNRTGYDDVWSLLPGRARGYELNDQGERSNIEYSDHCAYAAGGLRSTVDDLAAFLRGAHDDSLLSAESKREMFRPIGGGYYGYGWAIERHFERPVHHHTGGIDGFASAIAHYPDDALSVVVSSNLQEENAAGTACDLAALAFGEDWPTMSEIDDAPLPSVAVGDLLGSYVGEGEVVIELSDVEGAVHYSRKGGRGRPLRRVDADTVALERAEQVRLRFERDEKGVVTGLTVLRCGEVELVANRRPS